MNNLSTLIRPVSGIAWFRFRLNYLQPKAIPTARHISRSF